MSERNDYEFFKARKDTKTYISKVFSFNQADVERVRNVRIVTGEDSDRILLGEIEGALCLRLTGAVRKTQVTALVTQDHKQVRRLTLQTFKSRAGGWFEGIEKDEFTFRSDEFERLVRFLTQIEFIDLTNEDNFQIEDISKGHGPKTIIDASDRWVIDQVSGLSHSQRASLLQTLRDSLTRDEINLLLGRRQGLEEFENHISARDWKEADWQDFFDRQQWVFGYGLDYRVMRQFGREMMVGGVGTDNRNKPVVDFLMSFTDYTVLVEIKRPDTRIFKDGQGGRAGTWEFSPDFIGAISQVAEQKAEWLQFAGTGDHFDKSGQSSLEARTKNARTILVIGSSQEFSEGYDARTANVRKDTFELFRREVRSIDILTFDELLERARFITRTR